MQVQEEELDSTTQRVPNYWSCFREAAELLVFFLFLSFPFFFNYWSCFCEAAALQQVMRGEGD